MMPWSSAVKSRVPGLAPSMLPKTVPSRQHGLELSEYDSGRTTYRASRCRGSGGH